MTDYYAILGVLPSAEDIVIRAAYKALSQRYHPDRFNGTQEEANNKILLINEAYSILSDLVKRNEYDKLRGKSTQDSADYFSEEEAPSFDPLDEDWRIASKIYPDIIVIEDNLSKISWRLSYSFKAYLLQEKKFENRHQIANEMENQFLSVYFGKNKEIINFARKLIYSGNKTAAKELNKYIKVLGSNINANKVIAAFKKDSVSEGESDLEYVDTDEDNTIGIISLILGVVAILGCVWLLI